MNLITAVTVNGAIAMAAKDKATLCYETQESRNRFEKDLTSMFYRLDKDQSQTVSRDELIELSDEDKTMMYGSNVVGNPLDIFDALDADGNGELTVDEFCSGMREVAYSHAPVEFKRIDKRIRLLHEHILFLKDAVSASLNANRLSQQDEHANKASIGLPLNEGLQPQEPPRSCATTTSNEMRAIVAAAVEETLRQVMPKGHCTSMNVANTAAHPSSEFVSMAAESVAMPPISQAPPLDAESHLNGLHSGNTESAATTELRPTDDPPPSLPRPDPRLPCAVKADHQGTEHTLPTSANSCGTEGRLPQDLAKGPHATLRKTDEAAIGSSRAHESM
jgi:hypothetical protein